MAVDESVRCWLNCCIMNPRFVSRFFFQIFLSHISACMERLRERSEKTGLRKVIKRVRQGPVCVCMCVEGWVSEFFSMELDVEQGWKGIQSVQIP